MSNKLLIPKIIYFSSNIVDKKWFENLLALKIERLVNVDIHANSTTILIVAPPTQVEREEQVEEVWQHLTRQVRL